VKKFKDLQKEFLNTKNIEEEDDGSDSSDERDKKTTVKFKNYLIRKDVPNLKVKM
jgi:hypothetical protein